MATLCERFLYVVYIANTSQNASYKRYAENISALSDYRAIDHSGVQNGALISIGVGASILHTVLTRGFRSENIRDVRVIEVTSENLAGSYSFLAVKVKQHFLAGRHHYPNLQALQFKALRSI